MSTGFRGLRSTGEKDTCREGTNQASLTVLKTVLQTARQACGKDASYQKLIKQDRQPYSAASELCTTSLWKGCVVQRPNQALSTALQCCCRTLHNKPVKRLHHIRTQQKMYTPLWLRFAGKVAKKVVRYSHMKRSSYVGCRKQRPVRWMLS